MIVLRCAVPNDWYSKSIRSYLVEFLHFLSTYVRHDSLVCSPVSWVRVSQCFPLFYPAYSIWFFYFLQKLGGPTIFIRICFESGTKLAKLPSLCRRLLICTQILQRKRLISLFMCVVEFMRCSHRVFDPGGSMKTWLV